MLRLGPFEEHDGGYRWRSCGQHATRGPGRQRQAGAGSVRCRVLRPGRRAPRRTWPPYRLGIRLRADRREIRGVWPVRLSQRSRKMGSVPTSHLTKKKQQQGVQGVEIGLRLAFALARAPGPLALKELA